MLIMFFLAARRLEHPLRSSQLECLRASLRAETFLNLIFLKRDYLLDLTVTD